MVGDPRYRTAWRRLWAGLADGVVFLPLGWLDEWIWSAISTPLVLVPWFVSYSMSIVAYSVVLHWRWGQTLGKRLTGVRVYDVSGGALSLRQAAMRDVLPLVLNTVGVLLDLPLVAQGRSPYQEAAALGASGLSPFHVFVLWSSLGWFILEVLTMLSSAKRRALHDFIAGTVVMRLSPHSSEEGRRLTTGIWTPPVNGT
jgi:uncharacterized RDD family membrane protein YckC